MPIPSEITALIERLNNELTQIEEEATAGLNLTRMRLASSSDDPILVQIFGYFNNVMVFVEITRRRIEYDRLLLASDNIMEWQIQESGEDLSEQLGRVLETKIAVSSVKNRLENWQ